MKTYKQKLSNGVKKKNQWTIRNIETNGVKSLPRSKPKALLRGGLTVLISVLIIYGVVQAGTITPPSGTPSAQFYTLSDIYNRLFDNSEAVLGDHSFAFSDTLDGTHYTLKQIYDLIPTINPSKLLNDTTYLGITGTMANNGAFSLTASASNQSVTAGYYSGGILAGDANLISTNIKSGINIFGVAGDSNIVDTSSGTAAAGDIVSDKIAWVDGVEITGSFASSTAIATTEGEEITPAAGAWLSKVTVAITNLIAGVIKKDEVVGGITGSLVPSGGDATTADVCSTKTFFGNNQTNWTLQTGALNPSASTIGVGNTYCGIEGTLLKNLYSGSASSGDYPIEVGGVDDYNANHADGRPDDAYAGTWTTCTAELDDPCGVSDAYANKKDNSTGLIWSIWLEGGGTKTWFWANNCFYSEDPADCDANGEAGCKCVKLEGEDKTGCEDLPGGAWRLPHQKELMQAYINGSWDKNPVNLSSANKYYWSATTGSDYTHNAWIVSLNYGYTYNSTKTNSASYRVRCVRP